MRTLLLKLFLLLTIVSVQSQTLAIAAMPCAAMSQSLVERSVVEKSVVKSSLDDATIVDTSMASHQHHMMMANMASDDMQQQKPSHIDCCQQCECPATGCATSAMLNNVNTDFAPLASMQAFTLLAQAPKHIHSPHYRPPTI